MRAYEEYKESGYDWLGKIPAHWRKTKLRELTKESNERRGQRQDLELLSVYREFGVIIKNSRDDNHNSESEDTSNYKYVNKDYLVINKMKLWQGSLGISEFEGIVSPAYIVCKITKEINTRYLNYLLRSPLFKTYYNRISYGIRVGQWDSDYDDLKQLDLFLPPREEQDAIVRFLNAKCAKIDRLIKLKERQIELLNEKKQNIINQAVTKGLDPHAPMKDSGVDWIGEIPEGWEVILAGRLINKIEQGWSPTAVDGEREQGQNAVLSLSAVKYGEFNKHAIKPLLSSIQIKEELKVKKNDILLTRSNTRQLVGDCCLVEEVEENTIFSDLIYRIKLNHDIIYDNFFVFYMISSYARFQIERMASGSSNTMPKLSHKNIRSIIFSVPQIDEQKKIASFIERELAPIKEEIENARKSVQLLQELKSRFIQECCTGSIKIDF